MSNLTKYLVIVGIMIAVGAMLLIYGSQTITGDLVIEEGKVNSLTQLEIKVDLDPEINTQGVYAVQTIEGKEYDISAVVIEITVSPQRFANPMLAMLSSISGSPNAGIRIIAVV